MAATFSRPPTASAQREISAGSAADNDAVAKNDNTIPPSSFMTSSMCRASSPAVCLEIAAREVGRGTRYKCRGSAGAHDEADPRHVTTAEIRLAAHHGIQAPGRRLHVHDHVNERQCEREGERDEQRPPGIAEDRRQQERHAEEK